MSRDIVARVAQRAPQDYPYYLPEDVALGRLLEKLGGEYIEMSFMDFDQEDQVPEANPLELVTAVHIRCKGYIGQKRSDVDIMKRVHEVVTNYEE